MNIWKEAEFAASVFENTRHIVRFEVNSDYKHTFFRKFKSGRDVVSAVQNLYALPVASAAVGVVGLGTTPMHLGLALWHAGHFRGRRTLKSLGKATLAMATCLSGGAMVELTLSLAVLDLPIKLLSTVGDELWHALKNPPENGFGIYPGPGCIGGFI